MKHIWELFNLDKKVALVTGGAGKYGSGIVEGLAEAGALVIIASRDEKNCRAKADELGRRGFSAKGACLDLADEKSILKLRDAVIADYGRIDILVNNAVGRFGGKNSREIWEQSMRVNAVGLSVCTTAFLEPMIAQKSGNIINIASMYGMVAQNPRMYPGTGVEGPGPMHGDYAFHRAGIINYTRYLAALCAEYNIRVNCISPGGLLADQPPEFLKRYNERVPLRRMAKTDDIKGAVVYLASEASAYVTGHNLVVDGGWTIW
jgi:NAD(P)-dependent dehydrogenase (short-subunit alcohol dehydrogenase family)